MKDKATPIGLDKTHRGLFNPMKIRFIGTAISGAVTYLGISLILVSLSIAPIDMTSMIGGFVTIGLGVYIFNFSTK